MSESTPTLSSYRDWLAHQIDDVLAHPASHAASPSEAEITLLTLMECYVGAWSVERKRSPDRDVARVVGLWRAACVRLRGHGLEHARLAPPRAPSDGAVPSDDVVRLRDGMARIWEDVRAMCP